MSSSNLLHKAISKIGELIMHLRYDSSFSQKTDYISPRDDPEFGMSLKNSYNINSKLSKSYTESSSSTIVMNINFYLEKKTDRECCLVERWVICGEIGEFASLIHREGENTVINLVGGLLRSLAVFGVSLPLWHDFVQGKREKTFKKGDEFFLDHEILFGKTETNKLQSHDPKGGYDTYRLPFLLKKDNKENSPLSIDVEYLSNLELVKDNLSSASNITFVLSEDGRTDTLGKINLRANMRDRFYSDDISEGPVIQKKNGRTQSAFWSRNDSTNIFNTLDPDNQTKAETVRTIKGHEITEDVEFLSFDRQGSKESECEFLIIDESSYSSNNHETSKAILTCIRKIRNNCLKMKPQKQKGIINYLEELDQIF